MHALADKRRLLVIGCGGAGKSTLARALGEIMGLPVVHLDREFWRPGWTKTPSPEWRERVLALIQGTEWIIDGNFHNTLELRARAADLVVYLDMPRRVCLYRALKRVAQYYGRTRPDLPDGCPEKIDIGFLRWIWSYPANVRPSMEAKLAAAGDELNVIRLTSSREVEDFVGQVADGFRAREGA